MDKSIVQIDFFGGETPVQSWGTVLGKSFYFRARWKYWSFEVGEYEYLHADIEKLDFYLEEEYGSGPYDAGYMPFADSREIITRSICQYLQKKGVGDTTAVREELLAWFDDWMSVNADYQKRRTLEECGPACKDE